MPRIQHPETGRFTDSWFLEESRSDGEPREKLFLPSLPTPWKSRWYRKKGNLYVDAIRSIARGLKPARLCQRLDKIRGAVAAKEREIMEHGQLANALSTKQRWMAAESFLICSRLGVELIDVVREFERTHPHGANARTLDQVRVEVVAAKTKLGRSAQHITGLDYRLRSLVAALGNKPITAITTDELQEELERHPDWNPTTVHSVTQGWKIAFNFAIRRGYLVKNPANRLELPKIVRDEPCVLTVNQAKALLAATLFSDRDPRLPACRAWLAIGMFAGLRPDEIAKLDWKHVDLAAGTIRVVAITAKDRDRRIVDISPNLKAWLVPIAKARGKVLCCGLEVARVAARAVLGAREWPQDVLRHTFASYHFAQHKNEPLTKFQMGHRDDGRLLRNHYCVPIAPAEARKFWGIVPPVALLMP